MSMLYLFSTVYSTVRTVAPFSKYKLLSAPFNHFTV